MNKVKSLIGVVGLVVLLAFTLTACGGGTGGRDNQPVAIQDFEFHWDETGGEAVFWFTNNSNYTVGSPLILVGINEDGGRFVSRVNAEVEPGGTSPRGTVVTEIQHDDGRFELVFIPLSYLEDVEKSHLDFRYVDAEGNSVMVWYDFVTGAYS